MRLVPISDTHLSRDKPLFVDNWALLAAWIADQHPDPVIHTGDVTADGAGVEAELSFPAHLIDELGIRWRPVDCGLRLQSGLAGDLRAGAHEPAYRSRSTCADYRAYWEYGGARLGCQADHRSPVKRPQPRRSTIKLRRAASGAGLCLHAAVRGPVAGRAFLPEGTFRAMDTPPP